MAAVYAYSNVLDIREREDMSLLGGTSERAAGKTAERRSPTELQLSEVEEILEHNTAEVGPELGPSREEVASSSAWTTTSGGAGAGEGVANDSSAAASTVTEEEDGEEEGSSSSDTMTESHEDRLSTEANSNEKNERRRTSITDGIWACLSPVVTTFWKKGSRSEGERQGEHDAFEVAFADIKQLEFVGSGAQGAVFSGEYRGEMVAVKKVKDKSYCNEICQLRKLTHRNIVQLRYVYAAYWYDADTNRAELRCEVLLLWVEG